MVRKKKPGPNAYRMVVGKLSKDMTHAVMRVQEYRRWLEDGVLSTRGTISLEDSHAIDVACSLEMHSHTCRYLLRTQFLTMSAREILTTSDALVRAKEKRNAMVGKLRLEPAGKSALSAFYDLDADEITNGSPTIAPSEPEGPGSTSESPSAPDALEGLLGDDTNDSTNGA